MYSHPAIPPSKPFLKYAGGKQRLLPQLLPLLPLRGRLAEPFVGAGSVFLAADFDSFLLNDANPDLVAVWVALKERPREFILEAGRFFVEENRNAKVYGQIRREFNESMDRFERAIRLPYLNKFGYRGIFRVTRKGSFNAPYGHPPALPAFPLQEMEAAAMKLQVCSIRSGGFEATMEETGYGDVVYCDPPYVPTVGAPSFTGYTPLGFTMDDQRRLVAASERAIARGATVLISNHDTPVARELYKGWKIHELSVRRSLSADAASNKNEAELVAILSPTDFGPWR